MTIDDKQLDVVVKGSLEKGNTCWNMGPHLTYEIVKRALLEADGLLK